MVKIHGAVYVILGLFIAAVVRKVDAQKLAFFFYAGIAFMLFGILKIIFTAGTKKETRTEIISRQVQQRNLQQKNMQQRNLQPQFKRCPICNNVVRIHDNFCSRCGAVLR